VTNPFYKRGALGGAAGSLASLLDRHEGAPRCDIYVNTSRFVLWQLEEEGIAQRLTGRGVQIVVDTCTYIMPVMKQVSGLMMTNSDKWTHYAPANIGMTVAFGSMSECVRSAFEGLYRSGGARREAASDTSSPAAPKSTGPTITP